MNNVPLTKEELISLWMQLGDIPIAADEDGHVIGEEETSDQDFYIWPKGTPRMEIWHWFDEQYLGGLQALLEAVRTNGDELQERKE